MACLTKTFLVTVGVFTDTGGSPQSALGITFLSLELLTVYLDQVLFSLASCAISRSDNTTPIDQCYILATLPPFVANILRLLQSQSAQIYLSIK